MSIATIMRINGTVRRGCLKLCLLRSHLKNLLSSTRFHSFLDTVLQLKRKTCCWESRPRIGSASTDFSCVAEFRWWYLTEYHFSVTLLSTVSWYQSQRLKFRKSVLLPQCWLHSTLKLSIMVWCCAWRQEQDSHLFNRWDLLIVKLRLQLLPFYRQVLHC